MNKNKGSYKILVIEDNLGDFALVEDFLFEQIESPIVLRAFNFASAKILLSGTEGLFDVILLDLSLPDKMGESLIRAVIEASNQAPVVVLTGYVDFDFGVRSLTLGVFDYLLKDELTALSLFKSIIYSIERKKIATTLKDHIKAIEFQNEKLKEISWIQSHVIRAPLARIMGLVPLMTDELSEADRNMMLQYLLISANELDAEIRSITDKTTKADYNFPV